MMVLLFRPEHAEPIIEGTKTQTRRIWPHGRRAKPGSIHQARLTLFGKPFCYLRVLDVYQEPLGAIDDTDAMAEGYADGIDYVRAFCRINRIPPDDYDPCLVVWVVKFELHDIPLDTVCPRCLSWNTLFGWYGYGGSWHCLECEYGWGGEWVEKVVEQRRAREEADK
jgi:hypothetical protein